MAKNEWLKRLATINSELSDLQFQAQDVGDNTRNENLLTAARKIRVAQSALSDVHNAFAKVKA
jgi:hypothetical protein